MTKKLILAALSACVFATPLSAQDAPDIELWRLDCGTIQLSDAAPFSDTHLWDGDERTLTDSCYLIRHGDQHMLWDTGLPSALKGTSVTQWVFTLSVERTITEQLADLGLAPSDVDFIGISHYHDDHIGQASEFPNAKLLIGRGDAEAVASGAMEETRAQLAPWLAEGAEGEVTRIGMDHDVFQDGSVVIKGMPGHTPGHSTLLVRLPETGDVMLTGDLYHFEEQVENKGIPVFNTNRADTLASFHRFDQMAENLGATVIIQHDPRHIDRLPAFPESAE